MKTFIASFLTALVSMLALDAVWLTAMAGRFYQPRIGHLMAGAFSLPPAVVFYLLYALGLCVFVAVPSVRERKPSGSVFLLGALFGLVAYGTYDLTNQATLKDWPLAVTLVDLAWGGCLTGTVAALSAFVVRRWA
jgi:uncharacterized membrane protein